MRTTSILGVFMALLSFSTALLGQDRFGELPGQPTTGQQVPGNNPSAGWPQGQSNGPFAQPPTSGPSYQPPPTGTYQQPSTSGPSYQPPPTGAYQPSPTGGPSYQPPTTGGYQQPPTGYGAPQPHAGPQPTQDPYAQERQDYGVPASAQLHSGAMHGPTPASIPGGQLITTQGVAELVKTRKTPFLLLDILGGPETLPGAVMAVPAHQPGSFKDQTQSEFGRFLQQSTGGNKQMPIVLYCQSTYCWMSYNAALRAINMGYSNVLWYRGGIEAWKRAGLQAQSTQPSYGNRPQ